MLEPVLVRTEVGPLLAHLLQGLVEAPDRAVRVVGAGQGDDRVIPDVLDPESLGRHRPDVDPGPLIHVGADMEPHGTGDRILARGTGKAAGQDVHAVELRMGGDPIELADHLRHLYLDHHAVFLGIDAVRRLNRKLTGSLEDILGFLEVAFRRLDERNAVHRVFGGLLQAADLGPQFLGYGQSGGIVARAVDAHAGRQLFHVFLYVTVRAFYLAVRIDCTHVVIDYHMSLLWFDFDPPSLVDLGIPAYF